jgi:hypothetical protein
MPQLLASPVAPTPLRQTTAQLVRQLGATKVSDIAAPVGVSLHHFTDLLTDRIDLAPTDLHRLTTVLTKQLRRPLNSPDRFESIRSLVIDPDRIATPDGRTAAELCGESWKQVRVVANDRACAAIDGANRFGEATVIRLAVLRTADTQLAWWGTPQWEQRVDVWSSTVRFAPRLKRAVRQTPELIDDELLNKILRG